MSETKFNIAVLIDGDNAQAKFMKEMLEEVSKYGKATIRRIYGDWTSSNMNSWKETVNNYSISPIQKFSYTTGKNSTDSSLIIDAMDILHSKSVDGFCIVSSDSDYTGLAKRIREEGLFVMGIGRKTTPIAFVNSCEIFTFSENLIAELDVVIEEAEAKKVDIVPQGKIQKAAKKPEAETQFPKIDMNIIDKAFEISTNEEEEALISKVGSSLRKIDPSFDSRTYGFKTLTQLLKSLSKYKIVNNHINGLNHPLIKLK
ncbi:NYN domain-containing protein [Dyadobacter luticola]|uniref:NYN domain-containing protein n=1 Tax=Dyadobacter luticola TaxID=1979387 RepID=A0A5R9L1E3_9BACT|nr:NYN domain-containing protein [Dyadobacter luticola]TLV02231.1 NYN domain-containing protein [Dyadobacter luticola]